MFRTCKYFIPFYFALISITGKSSPADTASIIDNIFNFDFRKADEKLTEIGRVSLFMAEAMNLEIRWWEAVASNDKVLFKSFENDLERYDTRSGDPVSELILSSYRVRYYSAIHKYYFLPAMLFRIRNDLNNVDKQYCQKLGRAENELFILYKSFYSLIYCSIIPFTDISGAEQNNSLCNIRNIIESGSSSSSTIGKYLLMKYYLEIEKDRSKATPYLSELHLKYPNNKIFAQLLTNY